jgi:hypothetical protein
MENVFDAQARHNVLNLVGRLRGGDRAALRTFPRTPERSRRLRYAAHIAERAHELTLPEPESLPRAA